MPGMATVVKHTKVGIWKLFVEIMCTLHTHTHSLSLSLSLSKPSNSINQLQDTLCHLLVGALMKYISSMFETHLSLFPPQFSIWQILLLFVGIDCLRGVSCMWKHSLIFSLPLWNGICGNFFMENVGVLMKDILGSFSPSLWKYEWVGAKRKLWV